MATLALQELPDLADKVDTIFLSETEPRARDMVRANTQVAVLYGDVLARDVAPMPRVTIYTAGFPCQMFSSAGANQGARGPSGLVVAGVLEYIACKRPTVFLLENVPHLVHGHRPVFDAILAAIEDVRDGSGRPVYNMCWRILDSKAIGGVPQSRPRLYIVGIMRSAQVRAFEFPGPIRMGPLTAFVNGQPAPEGNLPKSMSELRNYLEILTAVNARADVDLAMVVGDLGTSKSRKAHWTAGHSPCLTRCRAGHGGHWSFQKRRYFQTEEMESLMGMPRGSRIWKGVISQRQYGMLLGNGFVIPVVGRILLRMAYAANLITRLHDPWVP